MSAFLRWIVNFAWALQAENKGLLFIDLAADNVHTSNVIKTICSLKVTFYL